jgi:mono/diheme cytochrome c family protein
MRLKLVRLCLSLSSTALALSLAACGGGAAAPTSSPAGPAGDAAHGQTLFTGTCSACHGPDATGIAGLGKDLTTSTFVEEKTDADLLAFIKTGRPTSDPLNTTGVDMPPRGGNPALTDQDLTDIIAFIRSIHK